MNFQAFLGVDRRTATVHLHGALDQDDVPLMRSLLERAVAEPIDRLILDMDGLSSISAAGVRCLASVQQRSRPGLPITLIGVGPEVGEMLRLTGFAHAVRQRVA